MPSAGTVVTAVSAVVAFILIANFFNWMLTLVSGSRFVFRLGLILASCLYLAVAGWLIVARSGVVYLWGGNKASAVTIACVFLVAGVSCLWQAVAQMRASREELTPQ